MAFCEVLRFAQDDKGEVIQSLIHSEEFDDFAAKFLVPPRPLFLIREQHRPSRRVAEVVHTTSTSVASPAARCPTDAHRFAALSS